MTEGEREREAMGCEDCDVVPYARGSKGPAGWPQRLGYALMQEYAGFLNPCAAHAPAPYLICEAT